MGSCQKAFQRHLGGKHKQRGVKAGEEEDRAAFVPAPMAWITRFLTAVSFLVVGIVFVPDAFGSRSDGFALTVSLIKLGHLLSFATAWGAALWVTFIGGIIMFKYSFYKSLP